MRRLRPLLLLAVVLATACNTLPAASGTDAEMVGKEAQLQKTMYVAAYTRTCTGMYEMQCMLVKENPADEWSNFYDAIEGFSRENGYEYELIVGWREIPNPPADGSSRAYWLVRVVKRQRVGVG